MKRVFPWPAAAIFLVLAACGPGELIVTAEVEMRDPETQEMHPRPVSDLEVQLLPFDRDFIFDSLGRAAERPEPVMPEELRVRQDSLLQAREEWRLADTEVVDLRDRLQQISREMQQYNPAEARYRELFFQFEELETRLRNAEQRRDEAFARYDELQLGVLGELEQARVVQETWEDEAFADYGVIVQERLRDTGREILADTTDASGTVRFRPRPGEWWVYARYPLPTEELYWNIRVNVERGEPLELRLDPQAAEVRPLF